MSKTDTSLQRRPYRAVFAAGKREFTAVCQIKDRVALLKENLASNVCANRLPGTIENDEQCGDTTEADKRLRQGHRHYPRSLGLVLPFVVSPTCSASNRFLVPTP